MHPESKANCALLDYRPRNSQSPEDRANGYMVAPLGSPVLSILKKFIATACERLCPPLFLTLKKEMSQVAMVSRQVLLLKSTLVFARSLAPPRAHLTPFASANRWNGPYDETGDPTEAKWTMACKTTIETGGKSLSNPSV